MHDIFIQNSKWSSGYIPAKTYLIPVNTVTRKQHSLSYLILHPRCNCYLYSFFPMYDSTLELHPSTCYKSKQPFNDNVQLFALFHVLDITSFVLFTCSNYCSDILHPKSTNIFPIFPVRSPIICCYPQHIETRRHSEQEDRKSSSQPFQH